MPEVDADAVLALEERALNAWPALQTVPIDGWALRFAGGCTKRSNSANALTPRRAFAPVRREAERLYARAGLPTIFRLSPLAPTDADVALADAGYAMADRSLVMIADPGRTAATPAVELAAHPDSAWLEGQANANAIVPALRPAHAAIVGALRAPAAFATLRDGDEPIGFGLAVAERGLVGLFDLVVVPARRGQGHGRALCEALLAWGRDCGARGAYLQVREDNRAALALYGSLGFRPAYAYHYRIAPAGEIA